MTDENTDLRNIDEAVVVLVALIEFVERTREKIGGEGAKEYEKALRHLREAHVIMILKWAKDHGWTEKEST